MDIKDGKLVPQSESEHMILHLASRVGRNTQENEAVRNSDINMVNVFALKDRHSSIVPDSYSPLFMIDGLKYLIHTDEGLIGRLALKALGDIAEIAISTSK